MSTTDRSGDRRDCVLDRLLPLQNILSSVRRAVSAGFVPLPVGRSIGGLVQGLVVPAPLSRSLRREQTRMSARVEDSQRSARLRRLSTNGAGLPPRMSQREMDAMPDWDADFIELLRVDLALNGSTHLPV